MECKAAGESVFAKEVLFEGNCEQAVDTELTLPDYCPDIGKLLKCRLVPMIMSRHVNFDSLVVEGTARISVIYLDDRDKKLRCCDRDYPFKANVPYDGNNENGRLLASVVGIGININQKEFSQLANATSLGLCTGREYGLEEELEAFLSVFEGLLPQLSSEELFAAYSARLFRKKAYPSKEYDHPLAGQHRLHQFGGPAPAAGTARRYGAGGL